MADLSDKNSSLTIKIAGADSSGVESNFVDATANGLKVDGSAVTQPISAVSLPLPSGAATEASVALLKNTVNSYSYTTTGTQDLTISGAGTLTLIMWGTWTGSVQIRGTVKGDYTDAELITGVDIDLLTNVAPQSFTSNGTVQFNVAGYQGIRLERTVNSGTLLVAVSTSPSQSVITAILSTLYVAQSGAWDINNISGTIALPTGASTGTKQDTGNTSLSSIDTKITSTNTKLDTLHTDFGTVETKQDTGNTSLSSIDTKLTSTNTKLDTLHTDFGTVETKQDTQITSLQLIDDIVHATNGALGKTAAIGGQLDDASTTAATEDNVASVRITAQRAVHSNLRNNAGTEVGTSGAPLRVDPTGTTTQPISDAGGSLTVDNAGTFAVQATIAAGTTNIAKAEDVLAADGDVGVPAMAVRKATPANTSGTDGDYEMLQMSAGRLWTSTTIDAALPAGTNIIGALTANQSVNIAQVGGTNISTGNGTAGAGTPRVVIASDNTAFSVNAVQSGTWTVQPGNTPNTTPWLVDDAVNTGRTTVMKTGSITSTSASADQVILTYTVTAGKTFFLEYFDIVCRLTTFATTATNFGTASLESAAGTKLYTQIIAGAGVNNQIGQNLSFPITIAASTVIRIVCTPSTTTSFLWQANFGGFEK